MKKSLIKLIITLLILIIIPYSCITALGKIDWTPEAEKVLFNHPEFIDIEQKWYDKLGTHYLVNLTENRILEFDQIDSRNGGGKYACLKRIGEFEVRGSVQYINKKGETVRGDTKESWSAYARFRDISQGMGITIETMVDVINHYDEILTFFKIIANEQYNTKKYVYRVDSEDRKAFIWVHQVNGYYWYHWHGVKEDEFVGENFYESENWREKVNNDLPKIRKSLGLE